ncbi:SGNH/GDSL hydrolase family protein [Salisediminibacterium halotolerans]|uniref:SGNH/GDSL hydrolase family protein n=1 Tax=Salisediminibacterium halotolerans TaxID=517425 RepID=A0A1H9WNZ7_9BACI|nr:hypothetical protein [Salisediminibacterium haloalkalitolerans]SES35541.1 hypothetical protein SAMN05444126_1412 [Salisediminibacterium haloalkalitolerans]
MKRWMVITGVIVSVTVILLGRWYYAEKLNDIATEAQQQALDTYMEADEQETAANDANDSESNEDEDGEGNDPTDTDVSEADIDRAMNLPEDISEAFINSIEDGEEITITVVASESAESDEGEAWPEVLESYLAETYDNAAFSVTAETFGEQTTLEMVQENAYEGAVDEGTDLVIFEPLLWNDNGVVGQDQSLEHITTMIAEFEEYTEALALTPSQPAFQTVNYPAQIEALGDYAEESGIVYLDHWSAWPDLFDTELLDYVGEEDRLPTEEGHALWGEAVGQMLSGE